ncbi:carboxylesterase family protein [Limnovirga soli]|uniref:Carboxylesterase family protein n=1 Tax=Limnovirga soli TaxID=2656915 RepID=A0A8J8FAD3_9BACT|nr:carboxylesterase family protein [Limnovirga soli]NNV54358.1 carboxylesterase family protein [Limnovirga soli]
MFTLKLLAYANKKISVFIYLLLVMLLLQVNALAQDIAKAKYCNTLRFDTTDFFQDNQIRTANVNYGRNTDWNGVTGNLNLTVYYPDNAADPFKKRPLIVLVHGGGFVGGTAVSMQTEAQYFARKGFVCASINYRLGWEQTCTPDNNSLPDAAYRSLQDTHAAIRYLVNNANTYKIDKNNIFMYGRSAGAIICLFTQFVSEAAFNQTFPGTTARLGSLTRSSNNLTNTFSIKSIGSVAGGVTDTSFISAENIIPVAMFQGTLDDVIPFATGNPYGCVYFAPTSGSSDITKRLDHLGGCYELDYQPGISHGEVYEGLDSFFYNRLSHFYKSTLCNDCKQVIYNNTKLQQSNTAIMHNLNTTFVNHSAVMVHANKADVTISLKSFYIIPNPAQQITNLYFNSSVAGNKFQISITNASGVIVGKLDGIVVTGVNSLQLDMGNYISGVYMIELNTGKDIRNLKLVKN